MTGLPSSARPSTSSGQQGGEMMNMQPGRIGPFQNQEQAPTMNMDRSRAEVSGSSNGGISDNTTYGEYGMQVSNSTQSNRLPPSVMSAQASSDTSAPGLHPSADMPAFSSMPFEYGSSSSAGPAGTGTVSGYQVGSSSSAGNGMVQSFDQRGQSSVYQDRSNQGPSYYNAGKGQGEQAQSSSVDQESFEVSLHVRLYVMGLSIERVACHFFTVHET
ncbi:hypothetical protein QFC19_006209 [Naganishia cerealis]|uniref:Uncharacterized protein n=1 Tax=Naganishia cerealis TaxID=610337 RepID=A0ACC2VID9_9TREE|nr:hypothetical protein QFC19_006209 [Naganishia cerealis]